MAKVNIAPMPARYAEVPMLWRPGIPPIFDTEPTDADIALARALVAALDAESRRWYAYNDSDLFGDLA